MIDARAFEALPGTTYNGFATPTAEGALGERPRAAVRRRPPAGRWLPVLAVGGAMVAGIVAGSAIHRSNAEPPVAASRPVLAIPPAAVRAPVTPAPPPAWPAAQEPAPPAASPAASATIAPRPAPHHHARSHAPQPVTTAARPAFHCDWRLRASEKMVCRDPTLAALDQRLNRAFSAAVRAGVPRAPLRRAQDQWVFHREVVARRSRGALIRYYEQRISELSALSRRPH